MAAPWTRTSLIEALQGVELLGIRSKTMLTERVMDASPSLIAVGAFSIGTNQIDLEAAAKRGIAAFNAPFSNTRSVVEMAVSEMISLTRRLPVHQAHARGRVEQVRGRRPRNPWPHARHRGLRQHRFAACPSWPRLSA
ncbi:hypothetical protein GCM10025876_33440 [Demequina litorisediminis]|uniref:D-isomer specific 2-hydroxyacid dehydrogenase catalytic domain-containing protein n=1 Tax=Demequina litorisediminis TaxID=1849022 RepID=A0ABQ6IIL0_9MICO|nr:hypothetical protein GCM10025876_33440 [Demequina litorisediminis]